jgi:hypothetical protein
LSLFGASPGSGGHRKTIEAPFSFRIGTFRRALRLYSLGARRARDDDCGNRKIAEHRMRALTVAPGVADSARFEDVADPPPSDGAVLVRTLALGVCGTDREIVSGAYGWAPPGSAGW